MAMNDSTHYNMCNIIEVAVKTVQTEIEIQETIKI